MKHKQTKNLEKLLILAMLLGIISRSNAQVWGTTTPTTILGSTYTGVQGASTIGGALQITTTSLISGAAGYLQVGPQNSTYCHFVTNASLFYFNKTLSLQTGLITSYESSNLILATGTTGTGNAARMTFINGGGAGIGTPNPINTLDVNGNLAIGSYAGTVVAPSNGMVVSGNVGIGTATPAAPLTIHTATSPAAGLMTQINNVNYSMLFASNATSGAFNWNTAAGDNGISWSDGLGSGAQNSASGFIIAPWAGSSAGIKITAAGNVGIGTSNPGYSLDVVGTIRAYEVKVCLNQSCDFVFDENYKLMPLDTLTTYLKQNHHLPEIASAKEMETEGTIDLG